MSDLLLEKNNNKNSRPKAENNQSDFGRSPVVAHQRLYSFWIKGLEQYNAISNTGCSRKVNNRMHHIYLLFKYVGLNCTFFAFYHLSERQVSGIGQLNMPTVSSSQTLDKTKSRNTNSMFKWTYIVSPE